MGTCKRVQAFWASAAMVVLGIAPLVLCGCAGTAPPPPTAGAETRQARTFNSNLKLEVWAQTEAGGDAQRVGVMPATEPVEIPAGAAWWVSPIGDTSVEAAAREVRAQSIPGLKLQTATDADLVDLKDLAGLQSLNVSYTAVTDAGLANLKDLKGLRTLNLWGTQVTDAGLVYLKDMTGLQALYLGGTGVTDAGLEQLKGLTGLQTLDLSLTKVTDAGLKDLAGLTGLQTLYLQATQVTDAGMQYLTDLKGLKTLDLGGTKVTHSGLSVLRRALPGCKINH